jgi:hypothetical protein
MLSSCFLDFFQKCVLLVSQEEIYILLPTLHYFTFLYLSTSGKVYSVSPCGDQSTQNKRL